jgi:membrane protein required for colicin V production
MRFKLEKFQIFDIVVISLIALLGLKGLFRGFIKEIFALIGLVGGVFVASRFSSQVGNLINNIIPIDNNNTLVLLGFIGALVIFWIIAYFTGLLISKIFNLSGLGIIDGVLGFVFSAGKIFLLFAIIIYATSQIKFIDKKIDKNLSQSIILPLLKQTGAYIIKLDTIKLEGGVKKHINGIISKTKNTLNTTSSDVIKQKLAQIKSKIKKTIDNNTTKG